MQTKLPILTSLIVVLSAASAFAAKDADLKPILAQPGKATAADALAGDTLSKTWAVAKGDWQLKDGTLTGKEKAADKHPAVCALSVPNHDSIIRFSFKFDGTDMLALSYNHPKGHLFRVSVSPTAVSVSTDKDKAAPNSKATPLGKGEAKFENGQWYTMLVEVKGDKVAVQTDNGVKIEGANPALDVDKTGYRFVTKGESLLIADVKTWEAVK
jgi:hypothetical protein